MKTIIARFQELKKAVGDSVEIDGELVDVNKVDTALKSVGVQLRDSITGQFRDLDDVFLELSSKWGSLDKNTQRYIATIAAGSRQQSRFIAMMDNYERTLELVDIAQNSNGASAEQFSKTLDSLETKINNIKSSFEEFIGTIVGSEIVKDVLSGANTILQVINDIADAGPAALTIFGIFFIKMIKNISTNIIDTAKVASLKWQEVSDKYGLSMRKENKKFVTDLENRIKKSNIAKDVSDQVERGISGEDKVSQTESMRTNETNLDSKSITERIKKVSPAITMAINSIAGIASSAIMANAATKGTEALKGAMAGNMAGSLVGSIAGPLLTAIPVVGPILGPVASALGGTLGSFIGQGIAEKLDEDKYGIGSQKNIKKLQEEAQKISEETSKSIEKNTKLISLGEEYLSLSEKINLTNEEKERLIELNSILVDQWDGLGYINDQEEGYKKILINQLKEEIKLKKEAIALDTHRANTAKVKEEVAQNYRTNTEALEKIKENNKKFYSDRYNKETNEVLIPPILENYKDQVSKFVKIERPSEYSMVGDYVLDFDKITEEDIKNNLEFFKLFNEDIEKYVDTTKTNIESLKKDISKIDSEISSMLDAAFVGTDKDSFAYKNKQYLTEILKAENILGEEEYSAFLADESSMYEEVYKRRAEAIKLFIEKNDSFNEKQKEALTSSLTLIGFLGKDKNTSKEKIQDFLDSELGDESKDVKFIFDSIFDAQYDALSENWNKLLGANRKWANEFYDSFAPGEGGEKIAAQFASIAAQIGDMSHEFMGVFRNQFEEILNTYTETGDEGRKIIESTAKEFESLMDALVSTNITSENSIAQLSVKLKALKIDEKIITQITNSLGDAFQRTGMTADDALSDIETQLDKINNLISIIENNISGTLSIQQIDKINSLLEEQGQTLLENAQIVATGEGFKIQGDTPGIITKGQEGTANYMMYMAKNAAIEASYKRDTGDLEEANRLQKVSQYYLAAEADMRARTIKAQMISNNNEQKRLYNLIQQYKDMIAEMNRYYNIQRKILQLQNEQKDFELDFELATGSQQAGEAARNQILNLVQQQALLKQAGQIYQKDLQELGNYINRDFGQFLTVDSSGNISQKSSELVKLAKRMEGASEKESKELQKQWDTIKEVQSAYEDLYDTVNSNSQEYKQNLIAQRNLEQQIKQYQINLENKLRDMIIKNMQDEVKAVQNKYNKIKQEDQKYLSALQKNINKRKQMQSDKKSEKEIETIQKRIGLLSRDTSGIYVKEIEDLQSELDDLLEERANDALDKLYQQEEEKTQKVAEELELRSNYLQSQLDEELKTYEISNKKVADLLKLKDEEILNWMKQHSEEFRRGTTLEQEQFIETWEREIQNGKIAQDQLTENLEENKIAILQKFEEIETGGINEYIKAVQRANNEDIVLDVDTSGIEVALRQLNILDSELEDFYKKQSQAKMDSLLLEIEEAYSRGDTEEGGKLKNLYDTAFSTYRKYGEYNKEYAYGALNAQTRGLESFGEFDNYKDNSINRGIWRIEKGVSGAVTFYKNGSGSPIETINSDVLYRRGNDEVEVLEDLGDKVKVRFLGDNEIRYIGKSNFKNLFNRYATGGIVDYTGPAWVDGTKSKPEAFLSAADTANIAKLRDILSKVFKPSNLAINESSQNQNAGDTYYEFHITVDELGDGYDAEQMMRDMEKYIIQKSNYRNVINIGKRK